MQRTNNQWSNKIKPIYGTEMSSSRLTKDGHKGAVGGGEEVGEMEEIEAKA